MEAVLMNVRHSGDESHHIETSIPDLYLGPDTANLSVGFSPVVLSAYRLLLGQ
jgi:hypothetical protein